MTEVVIGAVVIVVDHVAALAALWLALLMLTNHTPAIGRDREQLGDAPGAPVLPDPVVVVRA